MIRRVAAPLAIAAAIVLAPMAASAHPLGNFTVNLYSGLSIGAGEVHVDYVVDMAEDPTYQARSEIDTNRDGRSTAAELAPKFASGSKRNAAPNAATDGRPIAHRHSSFHAPADTDAEC